MTIRSGTWRSDGGDERGDQGDEAYPNSFDFPLPFSGGHIASGRSSWDSPSLLLAEPLDFPHQPPSSIHLAGWPMQRSKPSMRRRC